ncbi:MAG: 3-phosphoshikimate 1-carboxyvinyltransferase, partial [Spirochaetales bacterium]|nr:3-phosphoshikimate 1-carboxyvinyltransferase [Spirochaetales bacterium]
ADGIRALGGQVRVLHDSMVVFPADSLEGGRRVDSFGDPRTAMAMAVASLRCRGSLTIGGCDCVDETFPGFFGRFSGINSAG